MLSTILELAGFAALTAAAYLALGLDAGLAVLGGELLLAGLAVDETVALTRTRRRRR